MQTDRVTKIIIFIGLLVLPIIGFSQLSKTHYIPPLTSGPDNAAPDDQYFYLSTPSAADIAYTIKPIGLLPAKYITGIVSNTNPSVIYLGSGNGQLFIPSSQTSTIVNDRGYIIEAEDLIYVSVRMRAGGGNNPPQAGALVSKGLSALGKNFRIGAFTNESGRTYNNNNGNYSDNLLSFVSVMATEDQTTITFSDISNNTEIINFNNTFPFTETLNKGESFTLAMNSYSALFSNENKDGLIGSLVSSDKPIVVNCGSANGSFHNGNGRDYGIDQIVGLSKVGTKYIFVKGDGNDDWENVLIVPHTPGTTISINGGTAYAITGKYELLEGSNYNANGNMYVETSEPVFAYQGIGGGGEANQGMFFVPPLSCEARGNIENIANIDNIGSTQYDGGISIVTKVGATITINNQPLPSATIGPSTVTGNPDYVTYKITGLTGNVSVQGDDELYVAYYNINGAATSGSFYSGFPSKPEINFDAEFVTLGNCIPNVDLSVANAGNFDSFSWYFDDGSGAGFVDMNESNSTITPTNPGKYKLIGTIACSGLMLHSAEVPVSICPDDIDNDGIIDNIDIDNDNDGILNCTESKGDVVVNLTNLTIPQFIFQDTTTDSTIPSGTYTESSSTGSSNTFTGTNSGNFTSSISASTNAENDYSMTFSESVNVKLSENISISHSSVNGEYFIAKILPVNKNITLIDPDNRLLIDSNFDGAFETGVTSISGSEIHFKVNPSPTGSTPYEFFANQVDGFTFKHILANINDSSTFQGIISLTCFKLDSDGDGIEDALDSDSDNDGIPDIIENKGELTVLSNVDADENGLDDIFNTANLPIDSDTDGVFDYLDLDSDNDGVFDLEESNSLLPDTNFDGRIDFAIASIGVNGWIDAAETAPDSGLIGYTISDSDTDATFNYVDSDSDGDNCFDVFEAGFSDVNDDGFLGDSSATVNSNGIVTNAADGYTPPNSDYLNAAPILIETQPFDTTPCELTNAFISIESSTAETYQWEISTDGINWNIIIDDAIYSNSQTSTLNINSITSSYAYNKYRVYLNRIGNSCGLYSDEISLSVLDLPILNSPTMYSQCDDILNDGVALFNLTLESINEEIAPNYIADGLIFTYFNSQIDAQNNNNVIASPTNYQNYPDPLGLETVWIRVENPNGCFSVESIVLEVNPSSLALSSYNPTPIYQCDDGLDIRDGISTFDLTNIHDHISNVIFSTFSTSIHFYENLTDAELETNEILDISNHQNTNSPSIQSIWVRVKSDLGNDCLGLEGFPNLLNVEALPIANTVATYIECDDDQDGVFPFNTTNLESDILNGQSLTNVSITYLDSSGNPLQDFNGTSISSPFPSTFLTTSGIVSYTITNNATNDLDGACTDSNTVEFIVDQLPINNTIIIPPLCDPYPDDGLIIAEFDTSTLESDIGAQPGMDITYFDASMNPLQNAFGNLITSPFPSSFTINTQTITVVVTNPNNNTCPISKTIEFTVYELPEFSVESSRIICESGPNSTITLEVYQDDPSEDLNYYWTNETGNFNSTDKSVEVSTSGIYTVTLTKTDGTFCSRTKDIDVVFSEKAKLDHDDVTIVDDSDNNTITIDEANLGKGDYEYSLKDEYGPYQDEPFFDRVMPGIHIIYVRDKNGCGIAELEISVIGFPKFFTPNNDGFNDNWKVLGVSQDFFPSSLIYIYDRFGKIIAKVNPTSIGWDGYYNGVKLPADDYWFSAQLVDSNGEIRNRKGHFSLIRR